MNPVPRSCLDTDLSDRLPSAGCRNRGNRGWKPEWSLIERVQECIGSTALGMPMGGRARGAFGLAGAPSVFQPSFRSPTRLEAGGMTHLTIGALHDRPHIFTREHNAPGHLYLTRRLSQSLSYATARIGTLDGA